MVNYGQFKGERDHHLDLVGSLHKDYCYKSVPTQIAHNAGLSRSALREIESGTAACEAVTAPQLYICISQVGANFWSREKLSSYRGLCREMGNLLCDANDDNNNQR